MGPHSSRCFCDLSFSSGANCFRESKQHLTANYADVGPNEYKMLFCLSLRPAAPLRAYGSADSIVASAHPALALASLRSTRAAYRATFSRA